MGEFGDGATITGLVAAADLSGKRYHAVRLSAARNVNQASDAANSAIAGVLLNKPESGQAATVQYTGMAKVVAGGAITVNVLLSTNGSGRAAATASGDMAFGRALESAAADGDIITCLLFHPVRWAGAV